MNYQVIYEATPNPNSMRFLTGTAIANETAFFEDPTKSDRSPLAQKIFGFPWAKAILISPDSITITKQDWVEWTVLADPLSDLIAEHLEREEGVLLEIHDLDMTSVESLVESNSNSILDSDSETVKMIKLIINRDIRPAVAQDGGDISFEKYENTRLFLRMQGACSGCPSAAITLKEGIEVRIKELVPEVTEVISV